MYFQKVLKGIPALLLQDADKMVNHDGILSNFWRLTGSITPKQVKELLTEDNVLHHLNDYDSPLPPHHPYASNPGARNYGDVTPFISTTAGTIERGTDRNYPFSAFLTALGFATRGYTTTGYIFYAYLITLGKKAVPLCQFAEEARELHIYQRFLLWHPEGEIMAKIQIPSVQIQKAEEYDGAQALNDLDQGLFPTPVHTINNPNYTPPEEYSNIRECIDL
jgi:hypothetical protein